MPFSLLPGILYLVFNAFEEIQVLYMDLTLKASPLEQAPLYLKLWVDPPLSAFTKLFLFLMRPMRWAFLIYLGFQTVWYYHVILLVVSIGTAVAVVTATHLMCGLWTPSLIACLVIPITGVWMWIAA